MRIDTMAELETAIEELKGLAGYDCAAATEMERDIWRAVLLAIAAAPSSKVRTRLFVSDLAYMAASTECIDFMRC